MEIDAETKYKICLFLILTCGGLNLSLIWTIQLLEQISIILKELFEYLKLYPGFFFFLTSRSSMVITAAKEQLPLNLVLNLGCQNVATVGWVSRCRTDCPKK